MSSTSLDMVFTGLVPLCTYILYKYAHGSRATGFTGKDKNSEQEIGKKNQQRSPHMLALLYLHVFGLQSGPLIPPWDAHYPVAQIEVVVDRGDPIPNLQPNNVTQYTVE